MKKIVSLLSAVLILGVSLLSVGCSTTPTNAEPVKLTLWHYYNGNSKEIFDSLVQQFNETVGTEQNILVDAYSYSGVTELADAIFASANGEAGAEDMPDIFASYSDNALRLHDLGVVADMSQYFTEEELATYHSDFLTEGYFGDAGDLNIIPIAKSTEIIYINNTEFEAFAADTGATYDGFSTWEKLSKTAEEYYIWSDGLTEEEGDGKALFGVDSMANFVIIAAKQLGVEIFSVTDSGLVLDLPKDVARKIFDSYYIPYIQGHYTAIGRFRSDDVKSGDLMSYVGSTSSSFYFPSQIETGIDEAYDVECATLPYPVFEGGENVAVQQGAGFVVSSSDESQESAAAFFLKWFTEKEQNTLFAASTGYMPVKTESLVADDVLAVMSEQDLENVAVVETVNTIYEYLNVYELFALSPFSGSYEARNVLEAALQDKAQADKEALLAVSGEEYEQLLGELTSDTNFDTWYESLMTELSTFVG